MELRIEARLHYVQNEIAVGIQGDVETRPVIQKVRSRFVKRGLNAEQSPEDTEGHYVDYNDRYHIKKRRDETKGNTQALGFVVETKDAGVYFVSIKVMTDDGEAKPIQHLRLRVE